MLLIFALYLSVSFGTIAAFPSNITLDVHPSCMISSYDEIKSVTSSSCTTIHVKSMTVPAGSALVLHLQPGVRVNIKGTITFEFMEWNGPLVEVKGRNVTIIGSNGAKLDGQGPKYWDGMGDKGRKKPKFFKVKTTGGSIFKNVHLLNCPRQCWSIDAAASNTTMIGCDVDITAGDLLGKNTDGYGISGSDITIKDAKVHNQDDCVVVNKGANIKVSGLTCIRGHGLSLSVGNVNTSASVENVTFSNCRLEKSRNGIHVKTHANAPEGGSITNVVYSDITMSEITKYGVNIQQDYADGKSTGVPESNVPTTGLILKNVKGTMNGTKSIPVYILCGSNGCSNFVWSKVSITEGEKPSRCNYKPVGFDCL